MLTNISKCVCAYVRVFVRVCEKERAREILHATGKHEEAVKARQKQVDCLKSKQESFGMS